MGLGAQENENNQPLLISAPYQAEQEADLYNQQQESNSGNLIRRTWVESKKMWHIAGPSIFTRLAMFSLTVITQAFAGHLSDHDLAAISIVTTVIIGITFGFLFLGLFCYVGCGGCPQSWTVFSEQAFVGLWDFFKLSVASGVMLSLENFYYRVLIIISGNMNNDEVQPVVRRIKKDVKRAPMMKTLETRSRPCRDEGFSSWRI
ncbi:hypothetical protein CsSME_00029612 [Camellia sinensis var. sinensis]